MIVEPQWVAEDGYVDIEAAGSVAVSGLDSYHSSNRLARFGYAKVDQELSTIDVKKS